MTVEMGISPCAVAWGEETSETGTTFLREWSILVNFTIRCFVLLGYIDSGAPKEKLNKGGRIKIIES